MKKIIFIIALFFSLNGYSQGGWLKPNNSYGTISNRASIDSTLFFPTGCGTPSLRGYNLFKSAFFYDSCNKRLYLYDPKLAAWDTLHIGGGSSLTSGSGITINGSAIDLGGNLTQNAVINGVSTYNLTNTALNTFSLSTSQTGSNVVSSVGSTGLVLGGQSKSASTLRGSAFSLDTTQLALRYFTNGSTIPYSINLFKDSLTILGLPQSVSSTDSVIVRTPSGQVKTIAQATIAGLITASNGLTKSASNIKLGGPLTENTMIDGDYTKTFDIDGVKSMSVTVQDEISLQGGAQNYMYGKWDIDKLLTANTTFKVLDTATHHGLTIADTTMKYSRNLGSAFTTRSLVDKGYVDSVAATAAGTVTSVSGTSNRITSTGGATPVIDISSSYVGQSSITTLGTIGTGTWQGTAVGAGFGGTGQSTYAVGDLLYASASTTLSKLADVATGNALISGGVTTAPSWGKIGLTTHVSGILPVANGGSGTSTAFTLGSVIFAGASGVYSQDNTNLFWDNTNKRIGMGTTSPNGKIHTLESGISDGVTFRGENSTAAGSTKAFTLGQMGSSGYGITGWASAAVLEGAADGGLTFSSFGGDTRWQTGSSRLTRMTLSGANLGIGITSPTALLHLAAGTATANTAPLKFTSGTLNTTAVAGQHEYNNSHYLTKNSALRYGVGGSLAQFTTDASNTGTSETDLHSYTTPASTLAADGDKIFFDFGGTMPDATATITIKVYFGGTQIYTSGAIALSGTGDYHITGFLVRVNSTTVRAVVSGVHRSGVPLTSSDYTEVTGLTLSNTNILKITGQAGGGTGGTGDIVDKLGQIRYEPVAAN